MAHGVVNIAYAPFALPQCCCPAAGGHEGQAAQPARLPPSSVSTGDVCPRMQVDMKDKWRNLVKQNRIQPHEITEIEASRSAWAACGCSGTCGAAAGAGGGWCWEPGLAAVAFRTAAVRAPPRFFVARIIPGPFTQARKNQLQLPPISVSPGCHPSPPPSTRPPAGARERAAAGAAQGPRPPAQVCFPRRRRAQAATHAD